MMDSKLSPKSCSINISDMFGKDTMVHVPASMMVEKIKETALKQLNFEDISNSGSDHRLVLINDIPRNLCDDKTAKQENIKNGDTMILIRNSSSKQISSLVKGGLASTDAPSASAIMQATESLPLLTGPELQANHPSNMDGSSSSLVEQTLRRVLLALLELSYKFMHFDEDSEGNPSNNDPKSASNLSSKVDPSKVKHLTDMGFSKELAIRALVATGNDVSSAMEWALSHNGDDLNTDLPSTEPMDTTPTVNNKSSKRKLKTRLFTPNAGHLATLTDMGFTEEESVQALRLNGNNPVSACEWLLSDRKVEENVDSPLDPESELYKALISNPTIHIGLHDRKVLEALEDMVENPWRRNNWAYESAVGNVILQILKLYNKYSTTTTGAR